jgi:hypothetical protein
MAQGAIKSRKLSAASKGKKPTVLGPKKGARTIAPKKAVLVKNAKMTKAWQELEFGTTFKLTPIEIFSRSHGHDRTDARSEGRTSRTVEGWKEKQGQQGCKA